MSRLLRFLNTLSVLGKVGLAAGVFVAAAAGGTAGVLSTRGAADREPPRTADGAVQPQPTARPTGDVDTVETQYGIAGQSSSRRDSDRDRTKPARDPRREREDEAPATESPDRQAGAEEPAADASEGTQDVTAEEPTADPGETQAPTDEGDEGATAAPPPDDGAEPDTQTTDGDSGETTDGEADDTTAGDGTSGDSAGATGEPGTTGTTGATSTDVGA